MVLTKLSIVGAPEPQVGAHAALAVALRRVRQPVVRHARLVHSE